MLKLKTKQNQSYYECNRERLLEYAKQYRLNHPGEATRQWKKWKEKYPEKAKAHKIRCAERNKISIFFKKYGIPIEEKENIRIQQNNMCSICGCSFKSSEDTHLDHNHKTGEIRELLCGSCNRALGLLREDINILKSMIIYIEKWKNKKASQQKGGLAL